MIKKINNIYKITLLLFLAFIISFTISSCKREEKYPDALRIGTLDMPKTLMPYASSDSANMYICGMIYDTLLGNISECEEDNYYLFSNNLVYMDGAYPKKNDSKYGFEYFDPTDEEYEKQIKRKNLVKGYDEAGEKIEGETDEEFEARKKEAVPSNNWFRYRFKVDNRYTWNDGKEFSSEDIVFTFKYILKNSGKLASIAFFLTNYFNCYDDNGDFVLELASNKLSDIKTICNSIFILPKHIWENIDNPNNFNNLSNPIGTGAYKLVKDSFIQDSSLALEIRDNYNQELLNEMFNDEPIKNIFLTKLGNEDVLLNAMNQGDIDVSLNTLSVVKANSIEKNNRYNNVKIAKTQNEFVSTLVLNVGKKGIFKDLKNSDLVRRAISLSINQDLLIEKYLYGDGDKVGDGLVQSYYSHSLKNSDGTYKTHEYNVTLANELLDDAGYLKNSNGERDLSFKILGHSSNETLINLIGKMIKDNIGINISFELADGTYSETIKQRNNPSFDMILNSVSFASDQLLMFDARFGVYPNSLSPRTWNFSGIYDEELSKLMKEMDSALTIENQFELCKDVQEKIASLNVEIPLYCSKIYSIYSENRFVGWQVPKTGSILNSNTLKNLSKNK